MMMTKEEFYKRVFENKESERDGFALHLKHLYENNNSKSLFTLTGIDFSDMFYGKEDTSGIQITNTSKEGKIDFVIP
jgi:hypothetical protein